ncbi:MAG: hypothetical protein NTW03_01085, partial [Verrucomicrobia bacterium]|nr:hypothetical protein [Verrucomicrobiota bacterium]
MRIFQRAARWQGPEACGIILFLSLTSFNGAAGEGEWSRFRGPNGTGLSPADTVPVSWTDQDYNWKIKLPGPGHASPVLQGRRIFLTCG